MASGISAASTVRVGNQIGRKDGINLMKVGNTSFVHGYRVYGYLLDNFYDLQ